MQKSKTEKKPMASALSLILLFVVLVSLGIATYKSYVAIKIQDDIYNKVWSTIQPDTNLEKTNVVYKMNVYDYTDCVLVNIPIGSNDLFLDGAGKNWEHTNYNRSKAYFKFSKVSSSDLVYDGVILFSKYVWFGTHTRISFYDNTTQASKVLVQSCFEYILPGNLNVSWTKGNDQVISSFEKAIKTYDDYVVTWQQQTEESILNGGIFEAMYQSILSDAELTNITTTKYTKQFKHITDDLQYIKAFKNNECINADIYCEYTRNIYSHNLPEDLSFEWYETEILGGAL